MAKSDIRLPPDIIRAIEEGLEINGEAVVKLNRGVVKVTTATVKVIKAQEI